VAALAAKADANGVPVGRRTRAKVRGGGAERESLSLDVDGCKKRARGRNKATAHTVHSRRLRAAEEEEPHNQPTNTEDEEWWRAVLLCS
jgi:hypothetical protein